MPISQKEKNYLRDLAKKQLQYANTPENKQRESHWYAHNDLKTTTPIVTIEEWTFFQEVARPLQCESEEGRQIEAQIINQLIGREDIDDDRVTPDFFGVSLQTWFTPFGLNPVAENKGNDLAYVYKPHITDLGDDFYKLGKSLWGIHPEATKEYANMVADVIGDILPIRMLCGSPYASPTQWLIHMMHMETLMYALMDYPELVHKAMDMVTTDFIEYQQELEAGGHLIANNRNQGVAQGTFAFTNDLSNASPAALSNMWGYLDSQETVGISSAMFKEFFFPYYKRIADLWGLLNYACCEPVHEIWDSCLTSLNNLRKVSISPWCNEEFMGNVLREKPVIYHRKPSPNYLGVDKIFDEEGFSAHIVTTLKAARGCHLEFSFRDIYSLQGEKGRAKRAVQLVKKLIEEYWV